MSFASKTSSGMSLQFKLISGTLAGFALGAIIAFFALENLLKRHLNETRDQRMMTQVMDTAATLAPAWRSADMVAVNNALTRLAQTRGIRKTLFQVWDRAGTLVATSDSAFWTELANRPAQPIDQDALFVWGDFTSDGHPAGARILTFYSPMGFRLQLVEDRSDRARLARRALLVTALSIGFIIVFGTAVGLLSTKRALAGVRMLERAAEHVRRDGDLADGVSIPTGSAETDRVAEAFNKMLVRIRNLIENQKSVMDNVAHDIRSPVARLRAFAERAIDKGDRDWAGQVIGECDEILMLIETLLEISAAEAGIPNWSPTPADITTAIRDAADIFEPLLESNNLTVDLHLEPHLIASIDQRTWQRVVSNLIDNAIKFSHSGGSIQIRARRLDDGDIGVDIEDRGIGIDSDEIDHIFERFHRADRSRSTQGSGLGLSFCRAAVEAMGGSISCASNIGEGTCFRIRLPPAEPGDGSQGVDRAGRPSR